jgi:ribose transport system permease protein/ribose transport system ATP-binding protein
VGSSALRAEGITKRFPGVTALDRVTLEVQRGEIHGVVGENGAGKSTLMAVVSGALAPDEGTAHIGGELLDPISPQRARELGVAIVRQEPALLPDLTVAENMFLGVPPELCPPTAQMRRWSDDCLRAWDADARIDSAARVDQLAPEQRFIVEIARALAGNPAVLILDEPTEHLAREDVDRLFVKIRERAQGGCAVVYISHRIREVKAIAQRVTVLRDGRGRGTYDAASLSEQQIVDLIVGRSLEAAFPAKPGEPHAGEPRLRVRGLRGSRFAAVDLDVRPGEIVGFAGIEDNGQRETLRALAGLARSSGAVSVDGRRARVTSSARAVAAGIAYLPGDRHREGLLTGLTVADNVAFRSLSAVDRGGVVGDGAVNRFVHEAIGGLAVKTPSLQTPIESLSGGNQQKALLAGVLATKPRVLLVDEPTQGVDIGAKVEIYRILRRLAADSGTAVVVLSADALELAGICDRVLVFSRGRIVRELAGDEVSEQAITSAALTATTERERDPRRLPGPIRWLAGDVAPLAVIVTVAIGLALYAALSNSHYLTSFNVAATLMLIAPLAAVAMGQSTVMMAGGIDLSVGPLMGFVVVVSSFFLTATNSASEQLVGWILIPLVALAAGATNWSLVEFVRLPPLVATLATFFALQALSLLLRPTPGGVIDGKIVNDLNSQIGPVPVVFIVAVAIGVALQVGLTRTRLGLDLRAAGSDENVARMSGTRPRVSRLVAYLGCSLLAGLGAIVLLAQVGSGDPSAGTNYTLISISAAVIGGTSIFGGRGSFLGAVAGAFLVQQVVAAIPFLHLSAQWESYLVGLMTLTAVAAYSKARQVTKVAYL